MAGKKNVFDLYNEPNPKTETVTDDKIVERDPVTENEKVVQKEEVKEEPKTDTTPEPKTDEVQTKESEVTENV